MYAMWKFLDGRGPEPTRSVSEDQKGLIKGRPDHLQRLDPVEIERFALAIAKFSEAGLLPTQWKRTIGFTSTHFRAMETAARLDPKMLWVPDSRLVERDWASYGAATPDERREHFANEYAMFKKSAFYFRPHGGESIYDLTVGRVYNAVQEALSLDVDSVYFVCHGETKSALRVILEGLLPHEWEDIEKDRTMRYGNLGLMQWTRINPSDPSDVVPTFRGGWMRVVDPIGEADGKAIPYDGQWVRCTGDRKLTHDEIMAIVGEVPQIL
jgi:broad specificity phosphatase PhoE